MPLVHLLGRLGWSRRFAATLNTGWRPCHLINYLGSCGGRLVLSPHRMTALMDRVIAALTHPLAGETPATLALTMHFPTRWDPYFRDTMCALDVDHYGTMHYDHHRRQLTISSD